MQGGLAQVVERSIRIRQAPGWRPGYSNWLFFTIIFIANFNASLLCQTEKVGEQKKCPRGISSSGRALDSHSRGTGIDTGFSNQFFFTIIFVANCNTSFLCQTEKVGEQNKYATGISSSGSARFAFDRHRDRDPDSNWLFFTIFHCQFQRKFFVPNRKGGRIERGDQLKWQSARFAFEAPHRYPILKLVFLYNYFRCQLQHKFFVPNRKGWRIEKMCKGDQLKWQSARFAFQRHRDRDTDNPIGYSLQLFSLPISTQVCCAKQKRLKNRNNVQGGLAQVVERWIRIREAPGSIPGFSNQFFFTIIFVANCNTSFLCQTEKVGEQNKYATGISSSGKALDSHSIGTGMETRILQLVILYNNFHCQFQRKFFVPNRKGWRIENMSKGDQLKWQSARFAFERHRDRDTDTPIGYCLQLFTLPISTQVCCAKQKRLKNRNNIPRGISSSGRALDSNSRGTGIETRILQLVILYNYFHYQFQRKFVVPNRKVWRKETKYNRDQLKWQSARFAFGRHRDRYPDSPISFSLQLFSLPIATQVFCAKQKRLENRTDMQGGLAQVVERSIRIRQAPGWRPGYFNWLFFTIIFIANFNASFLCQTEKVGEQKICPRGISSSGRALDSHSRGTAIETRILQLVILYNYFRCQFQRKFVVPNRKG